MGTEKRLIDANELLEDGIKIEYGIVDKNFLLMVPYRDVKESIKKAPTIDAVPVVRCKECIRRYDTDECPMCYLIEGKYYEYTNGNGFCDRGERKEGAD